jgi:hypothetical protein
MGRMTREESWQAEGVTLTQLRHITSPCYTVSVHRVGPSLHGSSGAYVEMHAIDERTDPIVQCMARVGIAEGGDTDYRCACLLAEAVGINLKV